MPAAVNSTSPSNVTHVVVPQPKPTKTGATVSTGGPKPPKPDEGSSRLSEEKLSKEYEDTYNTVYDQAIAAGASPQQAHAQATAAADKHVNALLEKVDNKKDKQTLKQTLPEIREQVIYNKQLNQFSNSYRTVYTHAIAVPGATPQKAHFQATSAANTQVHQRKMLSTIQNQVIYKIVLDTNGGKIYEAAKLTVHATQQKLFGILRLPPSKPAIVGTLKRQNADFKGLNLAEAKALIEQFKNEKTLTPEQKSRLKALKLFVAHENMLVGKKKAEKPDAVGHAVVEISGGTVVGILGGTFEPSNAPDNKTSKDFYTEDKKHNTREKSENEDNSPRKNKALELGIGLSPGQIPGQQTHET